MVDTTRCVSEDLAKTLNMFILLVSVDRLLAPCALYDRLSITNAVNLGTALQAQIHQGSADLRTRSREA